MPAELSLLLANDEESDNEAFVTSITRCYAGLLNDPEFTADHHEVCNEGHSEISTSIWATQWNLLDWSRLKGAADLQDLEVESDADVLLESCCKIVEALEYRKRKAESQTASPKHIEMWRELTSRIQPWDFVQVIECASQVRNGSELLTFLNSLILTFDTDKVKARTKNLKGRASTSCEYFCQVSTQQLVDRDSAGQFTGLAQQDKMVAALKKKEGRGQPWWHLLSHTSIIKIQYSYCGAWRLFCLPDASMALVVKALADTGHQSGVFETLAGSRILQQAWEKVETKFWLDRFLDAAFLWLLYILGRYVRHHIPPPAWVACGLFPLWFRSTFALLTDIFIVPVLYWNHGNTPDLCPGYFRAAWRGWSRFFRAWNITMVLCEVFTTIVMYNVMLYVMENTSLMQSMSKARGHATWIYDHPVFLSFMILIKWFHFLMSLFCTSTLGALIIPALHAATQPESGFFLVGLLLALLGSFHAYYVLPIEDNMGTSMSDWDGFVYSFMKIFRLEALGDFDMDELEGVKQEISTNFTMSHGQGVFEGVIGETSYNGSIHQGIRLLFCVLSLAMTVVAMNVYIALLSSLYEDANRRRIQIHGQFRANYIYKILLGYYAAERFWAGLNGFFCCRSEQEKTEKEQNYGCWLLSREANVQDASNRGSQDGGGVVSARALN